MSTIGVPIKILHEAEGHIITLETTIGEVYRGKLFEAEDNMNCQLTDITVTLRDGRTQQLDNVFIRGSKIRFLILPDMLKNAPMFKNIGRVQKGALIMASDQAVRGRGSSFRRGTGMRGPSRGAGMRGSRGGPPPKFHG
uniref:Small nuclear ribonucleoprotein Sm D3 n=1 Tax=Rhabditophanes sp. KR3021 TaxID=114890 RepID=A0AC35TIH2_9BILA